MEALQHSVRVAIEFKFLLDSIERTDFPSAWDDDVRQCTYSTGVGIPCYNEVSYVNETIRSGLSGLLRLYDICHVLDSSRPCVVTPRDLENLTIFKQAYFAKLSDLEDRQLPFSLRLVRLVELGKLQVCFLGLTL